MFKPQGVISVAHFFQGDVLPKCPTNLSKNTIFYDDISDFKPEQRLIRREKKNMNWYLTSVKWLLSIHSFALVGPLKITCYYGLCIIPREWNQQLTIHLTSCCVYIKFTRVEEQNIQQDLHSSQNVSEWTEIMDSDRYVSLWHLRKFLHLWLCVGTIDAGLYHIMASV